MSVDAADKKLPATLPLTAEQALEQRQAISRALRRAARTARAPASVISGGFGQVRGGARAFQIGLIVSFVLMVAVPLLVESAYWGLIASKQYATELRFAVRNAESGPLPSAALAGIPPGALSGGATQDTQIAANYILSKGMVETLEKTIGLRQAFGHREADYFSRFDPADPVEELEEYWKKRVKVDIDNTSGIVSVNVRAFTPEDSIRIATETLELTERLVNDMSTRSRRDKLEFAKRELDRTEQALRSGADAMRGVRETQGVLDARASADALNKVIEKLQIGLSQAQQDMAALGETGANSPTARVLQMRISTIKAQIADYSQQIASRGATSAGPSLAQREDPLYRAQVELDIARQQYAEASSVFQRARSDLETQHTYLMSILRPTLAEKSTYPRRWWEWSIVVIPLALGWGLLAALAFVVRDNMAK